MVRKRLTGFTSRWLAAFSNTDEPVSQTSLADLDSNLCRGKCWTRSRQCDRARSSGRLQNHKSQSVECSAAGPLVALVTIGLAIVHAKDAARTGSTANVISSFAVGTTIPSASKTWTVT